MTPTSNGNRILNITDLNAEFNYDDDGVVTCWIPEHMEIDFGIGSSVIVIGNTSQREPLMAKFRSCNHQCLVACMLVEQVRGSVGRSSLTVVKMKPTIGSD